mmetsp:Transcript_7795/g.16162  ORF Transcript_7795/g.16162 Transcript_7795/m.16162 type:complete len:84 (-) Transcript_7795:526-777(-)
MATTTQQLHHRQNLAGSIHEHMLPYFRTMTMLWRYTPRPMRNGNNKHDIASNVGTGRYNSFKEARVRNAPTATPCLGHVKIPA